MAAEKPTYNDDSGLPDIHYNPLQNYRNVTYDVRLTMMPCNEATKTRHDQSFDYKTGIVMLETGGSGAVFLEELSWEVVGSKNTTGNYLTQMPSKISAKFVEPLGGRLIESISLSAMTLGYETNATAVYLLEIWFTGYDAESDMPVNCKGWTGEELVFRWYVTLQKLEAKIDYKGAIYDADFFQCDGAATYTDFYTLEEGFRMPGAPNTIGDFCKQLADALNKREEEKVKTKIRCIPHKYVITAHKDIASLSFSQGLFDRSNWSWLVGKGEMQGTPGQTIQQYLTNKLTDSQDLLKYLHRIPEKKDYNSADTNSDTIHLPIKSLAIIPGCKDIDKGGVPAFDDKLGSTAKEVHFFLTSREDGGSVVSPQEYKDAENPANRDKRVDNWIKKGLLRKVYKWIHTGENTEVIHAEIKIDNLWRSVRPLWIDSETGQPVQGTATAPKSQEKSSAKSTTKTIKCDDAKSVKATTPKNTTTYYAEDMPFRPGAGIAPKKGWRPNMPQFYHMNTTVQQKQEQGALSQENAQEYSVYRQVANQMAAGGADMFNMTLEVVGDPFWLCQVPGTPGNPPWSDDVWEYEKNQLTEEQMSEKRKNTSTRTWMSFIYFEAQIPSANLIEGKDIMDIRRADAISGVYFVTKLTNKFLKGKFTTTLHCQRDNLGNPWSGKVSKSKNTTSTGKGDAAGKGPNNASPGTPGIVSDQGQSFGVGGLSG